MADPRSEPTMEEILASIRRIIADPTPIPGPTARTARKAAPELEDEPGLEEISQDLPSSPYDEGGAEADDEPFVPESPASPPEEVLELTEIAEDPALVSEMTAAKAAERLQQLSAAAEHAVPAGGQTVESLVREMLRPMLKEWLDVNLPDIVDQVVSREIARLTGKSR